MNGILFLVTNVMPWVQCSLDCSWDCSWDPRLEVHVQICTVALLSLPHILFVGRTLANVRGRNIQDKENKTRKGNIQDKEDKTRKGLGYMGLNCCAGMPEEPFGPREAEKCGAGTATGREGC